MTDARSLFYEPWMGHGYVVARDWREALYSAGSPGDNDSGGLPILVLGESHYGTLNEHQPDNTRRIIANYAMTPNPASRLFTKVANVVFDALEIPKSPDFRREAWQALAFANYIQSLLSGPRQAPTDKQWFVGHCAFEEVLKITRPSIVLVLGRRLWAKVGGGNAVRLDPIKPIGPRGGVIPESAIYNYWADGKLLCSHLVPIVHPSGRGFRTNEAAAILRTAYFLSGSIIDAGLTVDGKGELLPRAQLNAMIAGSGNT